MSLKEKMTVIADAIREKTGQPGELTLDEMAAAIGTISAGSEVRRVTGSFTTDPSGAASVSCGFRPDVVVGYVGAYADMEFYFSFVFSEVGSSQYPVCSEAETDQGVLCICAGASDSGFEVQLQAFDWEWNFDEASCQNRSFDYTALKFT